MLGSQVDELGQAVTAVTNWRNVAAGVGIELTQVNFAFPGGSTSPDTKRSVVMTWDTDANEWSITAT